MIRAKCIISCPDWTFRVSPSVWLVPVVPVEPEAYEAPIPPAAPSTFPFSTNSFSEQLCLIRYHSLKGHANPIIVMYHVPNRANVIQSVICGWTLIG